MIIIETIPVMITHTVIPQNDITRRRRKNRGFYGALSARYGAKHFTDLISFGLKYQYFLSACRKINAIQRG